MSLGSDYLAEMYAAMAGEAERQQARAEDIVENGWQTATGQRVPLQFIEKGHLISIIAYLEATDELDNNAEIIAVMEAELESREGV